jgi:CTP-dependent riboflavin kinase
VHIQLTALAGKVGKKFDERGSIVLILRCKEQINKQINYTPNRGTLPIKVRSTTPNGFSTQLLGCANIDVFAVIFAYKVIDFT